MKLPRKSKQVIGLMVLFAATLVAGRHNKSVQSANLQAASVTLSNARLSFRGALTTGNAVGSSIVIIDTDPGDYPSTSAAQLLAQESVLIGEAGSLATHTVASTSTDSTFTLDGSTLAAGDTEAGDDVIASVSATQTVRLTTTNAVANGRFRVLVPALDDDGASADGIPDGGFFDFGTSAPTVTCPSNATATYDFVAGTATASAITIGTTDYHSFECAYSGTGAVDTPFDGTTNDYILVDSLINPAPDGSHSLGTADTHNILLQHLNANFEVVDSVAVTVGVIEAVRVTASVPNQLTFQIIGVATGTSACGQTTDVGTTPISVPFGELSISTFRNAAQSLTVTTNASGGFSVTAIAEDQMERSGNNGACDGDVDGDSSVNCIPDPDGANTAMSPTNADDWTDTADKGFAFSLDDVNATTTEAFSYDSTTVDNCTAGTYCARQFADEEDGESAQTIFSSAAGADNQNLYVCYKAIVSAQQAAGDYQNSVRYTATATF